MENFTDIFGDDLSGLDGLGDFANIGSGGQNENESVQQQNQPQGSGMPQGGGGMDPSMMSGGNSFTGQQQQGNFMPPGTAGATSATAKMSGYDFQQYRGMSPATPTGNYGGYPGYPGDPRMPMGAPRMGSYSGGPGMMSAGAMMHDPYSNYPNQMYNRSGSQGMPPVSWNQSYQGGPMGAQYPNGPQGSSNYRQPFPDSNSRHRYPGPGMPTNQSSQNIPSHGYPGQMPGNAQSGYPPHMNQGYPGGSQRNLQQTSQPSTMMTSSSGGPPGYGNQYGMGPQIPGAPAQQKHFPSGMTGYQNSNMPQTQTPPATKSKKGRGSAASRQNANQNQGQMPIQQMPNAPPHGTAPGPPGSLPGMAPHPATPHAQPSSPGQMYRSPYPHPSAQPNSHGPQQARSPATMSPRPMSPATSSGSSPAAPVPGRRTPNASGHVPQPISGSANSSLQQLEQMVMPGSNSQSGGPSQQQGTSSMVMKPPQPSVRGQAPSGWTQQKNISGSIGQHGNLQSLPTGAMGSTPLDHNRMQSSNMHPGMYGHYGSQQGMGGSHMMPHSSMSTGSQQHSLHMQNQNPQMMQHQHYSGTMMTSQPYQVRHPSLPSSKAGTIPSSQPHQNQVIQGQSTLPVTPSATGEMVQQQQQQTPQKPPPENAQPQKPTGAMAQSDNTLPTGGNMQHDTNSQSVNTSTMSSVTTSMSSTSPKLSVKETADDKLSVIQDSDSKASEQDFDREASVVTPKLDVGEYKSDYKDESDVEKTKESEPSSTKSIKPEEPSSTTSPQTSSTDNKPDSSSIEGSINESNNIGDTSNAPSNNAPLPESQNSKSDDTENTQLCLTGQQESQKSPTSSITGTPSTLVSTSESTIPSTTTTPIENASCTTVSSVTAVTSESTSSVGLTQTTATAPTVSNTSYQGLPPTSRPMPPHTGYNQTPMSMGTHGMPTMPPSVPHTFAQHPIPQGPQLHPGMRPDGQRMPLGPHGPPHSSTAPMPRPDGQPMMSHGPMPRPRMPMNGPGSMQMGPPMMHPPPQHQMHMEMQHIHQQLNHLYNQPQNPQVQQQINELQGRLHHLQQQLSQMPPGQWGPMGVRSQRPPGPITSHPMQHHGPAPHPMGPPTHQPPFQQPTLDDGEDDNKSKRGAKKTPKTPKVPKEKKPRKTKEPKSAKAKNIKDKDESNESPIDESCAISTGASEASLLEQSQRKTTKRSNKKRKKKDGEDDEEDMEFEAPPEDSKVESDTQEKIDQNEKTEDFEGDDEKADKKEKKTKVKVSAPKRPKPSKTLLQFAKKKRRRSDSGSEIEMEFTPPNSPKDDSEKRRSGRNTNKRKKYVDDVDLNLSEEEHVFPNAKEVRPDSEATQRSEKNGIGDVSAAGSETGKGNEDSQGSITMDASESQSGPNYAFVDPTAEDTMVVQLILAMRKGTRELESDDEEEKKENEEEKKENEEEKKEEEKEKKENEEEKKPSKEVKKLPEELEKKSEEEKNSDSKENSDSSKSDSTNAENGKELEKPESSKSESKGEEKNDNIKEIKDENAQKEEKSSLKDSVDPSKSVEKSGSPDGKKKSPRKKPAKTIEVEEFLVKFKNFSYLHCQWLTEEELYRGDKRIASKIKRFKQKREKSGNLLEYSEEEPFNPDYTEVDRVLDCSEHTDEASGQKTKHYLVKWRSLAYEDCTWELEADVDPQKIKDYERWKDPPSGEVEYKRRGRKHEWKKWDESPEYKNGNKLRPYQLEGVNWLLFSWFNGRNCLLADEMGLGKTIQSLCFVDGVFKYGIHGPFLVIAPLSTIPNWQREFELWTDMNVIVYHGSQTSRNMLAEYEMYYKNEKGERRYDVFKFHVLITTYECVISDILELREISWRVCVIDEAHRLKNQKCKLLEGLNLLEIESRLLLSGTPLQNNINELYSLLSFLEPTQFSSQEAFVRDFGDMQNEDQVTKLQAILKPLMLRRMKEDVEKSLKPKEETIVEVELTNIQKKYYRGILEKNFAFLQKGSSNANVPNLMNTMMELRKCCIHPYLLNGAEEQIQDDYKSRKNDFNDDDGLYFQALINSSGKMVLLDKLLPKLKSNGHRVLIFSQMVKMLDILEDYLIRKQYPFERIDGRIRGNLRQAAIDRFCRPDSDRFVFLLCTKAGGLGINLVAADTCIIYDSDWNPQNDLQAQARCHRIGQDKSVKIYRLITRNTYEREMFDRASLKLGLDKAVLQSMNTNLGNAKNVEKANQLSKNEIETLLKKGAYGALMDDDNAGDKFCEEDIEQILQRRTQTVTLDQSDQAGGSFSKASFVSNDTEDIAIDDPDFWAKWAKKADVAEVDEKTALMMSEPRSRKKINRGNETLDPNNVSDLDSSSDSDEDESRRGRRDKFGKKSLRSSRRGRRNDDDEDYVEDREIEYGEWTKRELFRIESSLLAYGWGRWKDIMENSALRKGYTPKLVEDACRMIVLYCISSYRGDEKIKSFIWDLITPEEHGGKVGKNHSGLSGPVPRGRKGRKIKNASADGLPESISWVTDERYDMEMHLDKNYRKHLDRHGTKLLLRIRMLYYVQHEILNEHIEKIISTKSPASEIHFTPPQCDGLPCSWWDVEADKSLLIGTARHGYERYSAMRMDPGLCFLSRCGPPDTDEIQEEMKKDSIGIYDENSKMDDDEESISSKTPSESRASSVKPEEAEQSNQQTLTFPSTSELNSRLRRLIGAYQRETKKEEMRIAAKEKRMERRERIEQVIREREQQKLEQQQKHWSKKEEYDFIRTLTSFGVDVTKDESKYVWDRFRQHSRLDKKFDDTLTEHLQNLLAMCKRVTGRNLTEEEELIASNHEDLPIEKAKFILDRFDFLINLRNKVVHHEQLANRLQLCDTAKDLPEWWIPIQHDRDLLLGAAKHGIARMEFFILNDPDLCFKDILKRHLCGEPLVDKKALAEFEKIKGERVGDKVKKEDDDIVTKNEDKKNIEDEKKSDDDKEKDKDEAKEKRGRKKGFKKEPAVERIEEEFKETRSRRKSTKDSTDATRLAIEASKMAKAEAAKHKKKDEKEGDKKRHKSGEKEKDESKTDDEKDDIKTKIELESKKEEGEQLKDSENTESNGSKSEETKDDAEKAIEREKKSTENEPDSKTQRKVSPFIEAPQISIQQMEQMAKGGLLYDMEVLNELMAQTYAAAIRWPKDKILQTRLSHIVQCIETGEWPVSSVYPLGDHLNEDDPLGLPPEGNEPAVTTTTTPRDTPTPMSETSEPSFDEMRVKKARKIDNGDEKSKIRTLLQQPTLSATSAAMEASESAKALAEKEMWETYIKSLYSEHGKDKKSSTPAGDTLYASASPPSFEHAQMPYPTLPNFNFSGVTVTPILSTDMTRWERDDVFDLPSSECPTSTKNSVEITPVNGDRSTDQVTQALSEIQQSGTTTTKASKLESALDRLGIQKRKLSDESSADKNKKKKRLDDIMFGLGAAKGLNLDSNKESASAGQSLLKKDLSKDVPKMSDLSKLQEMLGGQTDAKVQKWLADQMGIIPERPVTPSSSTATSGAAGRSPRSSSSNPMEWMTNLSGDEHVTVFNRFTGKKLSGTQGPKLKHLAQWLIDNPMFEVDPKWAELVKNKQPPPVAVSPASSPVGDKRKGPGRPTIDNDAKKTSTSGIGPSFSSSGLNTLAGLGVDPKNPLASLASLDPKNPMSLAALYGLDPKKLDPMTAALLGMGDPKNPGKLDPMMLAALGMDSKSLQAMGIDPKTLGIDPKAMQNLGMSGMDQKTLQAMGLDPKLLQSMGLDNKALMSMMSDPKLMQALAMDPKILQSMGMDPKVLQSMGLDQKSLQSMGLDSKTLQSLGLDPKMLQLMGLDSKGLQAMGLDPKSLQALGLDSKTLQAMTGIDPKVLQSMGLDMNSLQAMGLDPKMLQSLGLKPPTTTSDSKKQQNSDQKSNQNFGMDKLLQPPAFDPKLLQAMGLDQKSLQALGLDAKTLQAMGIDTKTLQAMGIFESSSSSKKSISSTSTPSTTAGNILEKTLQSKPDSKVPNSDLLAQAMGIDPKKMDSKKVDSSMLSSLGIDPKNLKIDPMTLTALGLDPKNPNSSLMAAMAAMDPSTQLAAMYGYGMPGMMNPLLGLPGMDMFGFGKTSKPSSVVTTKEGRSTSSPRTSRASPSPRPPSRASSKSDERRSPRSSTGATTPSSGGTKVTSSSSLSMSQLGFDPKLLAGMDPKLLQAAGIDPKTLGLDPRTLGLDPKTLQAYGLDPKLLQGLDPKLLAGVDPKLMTSIGAKMMDPKALFGGIDPKMLGIDPKMFGIPDFKSSKASAFPSATMSSSGGLDPRLLGLDPKMLQGLDPKSLQSLGLDPKLVSSLLEQPKNSKESSHTSAKMTSATTPTYSSLETKPTPSTSSPKTSSSSGKSQSADLKSLGGMDPKILSAYGIDPKLMSGFDPKLLGMDPAMLGLDPKFFGGMDPKLLAGFDPKMFGLDPKHFPMPTSSSSSKSTSQSSQSTKGSSQGLDLKSLSGFDPKMFGMDPETLAKLASLDAKSLSSLDPKFLSGLDPSLASMYSLGMGTTTSSTNSMSSTNGIGMPATSAKSSSSSTTKPKPGTVAAALAERKNAEKMDTSEEATASGISKEKPGSDAGKGGSSSSGEGDGDDSHKGLTSEERVLLREKKRERLKKAADDEGDESKEGSHEVEAADS